MNNFVIQLLLGLIVVITYVAWSLIKIRKRIKEIKKIEKEAALLKIMHKVARKDRC